MEATILDFLTYNSSAGPFGPVFLFLRVVLSAIYPHPAAFPGVCDTQTLYFSMTTLKKLVFTG
jgi:hypothetical protein